MDRIVMQFPLVKGSSLYNGEGHFIVPVDVVKLGNTNVFVLEYNDNDLEKRSRALVQSTARGISHIPLMNKTGLNKLFEENINNRINIKQFIGDTTYIAKTKIYPDLSSFLKILELEKDSTVSVESDINDILKSAKDRIDNSIERDKFYVHENLSDRYAKEHIKEANTPDYVPEKEEPTETYRGDLGFYSNNPTAVGPGRQSGFGNPFRYTLGAGSHMMFMDQAGLHDAPHSSNDDEELSEDAPKGPKM